MDRFSRCFTGGTYLNFQIYLKNGQVLTPCDKGTYLNFQVYLKYGQVLTLFYRGDLSKLSNIPEKWAGSHAV